MVLLIERSDSAPLVVMLIRMVLAPAAGPRLGTLSTQSTNRLEMEEMRSGEISRRFGLDAELVY